MSLNHRLPLALSLGLVLLAGCATPPDDPKAAARSEATDPVTGSNLPRRDRKSVGNVIVASPAALREAQERASSRIGAEN